MITNKARMHPVTVFFLLILLHGCGIHNGPFLIIEGRDYPTQNVDKIVKGKTSQEEIIEIFGEPYIQTNNKWTYYLLKERTGTDRRWFGIPIKHHQSFKSQLTIIFKERVVDDFTIDKKIEED